MNLVTNSIKFTFTGGIKIIINIIDHSNTIEFEVEDTGCGIPKVN